MNMETDKGRTKPQAFQKLEEARKDPAWSLQMVSFCAGVGGEWGLGGGLAPVSPCRMPSPPLPSLL